MSEWTKESLASRTDDQVGSIVTRVLNRVCKWRSVFAGWQLGTRLDSDPESRALRDHREVTILLRVELNAFTALLIDKGLITAREFTEHVILEAGAFDETLKARFPGITATDAGIVLEMPRAAETMKDWPA